MSIESKIILSLIFTMLVGSLFFVTADQNFGGASMWKGGRSDFFRKLFFDGAGKARASLKLFAGVILAIIFYLIFVVA